MSDVEKTEETTAQEASEKEQEEKKVTESTEPSAAVQDVLERVKKMTVLDLAELVKALEETFGVSAAAPVTMVAAAPSGAATEAEEKTSFDVVLSAIGGKKIQVIKAVRAVTNLGLKEAKELVDKGPGTVVKAGTSKEEAETIKGQLEEAGATVQLE